MDNLTMELQMKRTKYADIPKELHEGLWSLEQAVWDAYLALRYRPQSNSVQTCAQVFQMNFERYIALRRTKIKFPWRAWVFFNACDGLGLAAGSTLSYNKVQELLRHMADSIQGTIDRKKGAKFNNHRIDW